MSVGAHIHTYVHIYLLIAILQHMYACMYMEMLWHENMLKG